MKILVADRIAEEGLAKLQAAEGATVDVRIGLGVDELAAAVAEYDGMIIRSGVTLTQEILADPGNLRVIARAGVGVDNVDLPAATAAAEPPEDPPGTRSGAAGFFTGKYAEFSFDDPIANSSQFALPTINAPACSMRSTAVAS